MNIRSLLFGCLIGLSAGICGTMIGQSFKLKDDSEPGKSYLTIERSGTAVDRITIDLKGLCEERKK